MSALCIMAISVPVIANLSGCEKSNVSDISEKEVLHYSDNITLKYSWWGNDARHIYTMDGLDIFEKQNTGIVVQKRYGEWNGFEKRNKVWMRSNTEADVMQINFAWISQYSPDGFGYYDLYELSDYIGLDNFTKEDLALGEVNGHLNAIPIAYNTSMYAASSDIYAAYGLEVPTKWEDLFAAAEVMGKDGVYPLGGVKKQIFLALMAYYEQTYGHGFFDNDGKLAASEEEIANLVEFYASLIREGVMMPIDQFSQEDFAEGNVASSMFWISDTGNYCSKAAEKGRQVVITGYPTTDNPKGSGRYIKPATLYAISKNTENPVEAAKLLDFLLNSEEMAELQGTEKGVPISKNAYNYLESTDKLSTWQTEATEAMQSEMSQMSVMIPMMENETVIDLFKTVTDDYYYEQISLEEAANQIFTEIKAMEE